MTIHVLGVNSAYHESSACLLRDGEIVAMAEEERFNRIRYGKHSRVDNPDELPEQAIAWCLKQGGIDWKDLTAIGYSLDPEQRRRQNVNLPDAKRMKPGEWGTPEGEETYYRHSLVARDELSRGRPRPGFISCPTTSVTRPRRSSPRRSRRPRCWSLTASASSTRPGWAWVRRTSSPNWRRWATRTRWGSSGSGCPSSWALTCIAARAR